MVSSLAAHASHNPMKARVRSTLEVLAGAAIVALFGAGITRGVYDLQLRWLGFALAGSFALLVIAGLFQPWLRTRVLGARLGQCALAVFLSLPLTLLAGRAIVRIDLWRAKRYVASALAPRLEEQRIAGGAYPAKLDPWPIRNASYASDGRTYTVAIHDPGVCGRVTTYSSATKRWRETNDPCWY